MVVADASVLIVLAKIGRLELLKANYGAVAIGHRVHAEVVVHGGKIAAAGVEEAQRGIDSGWIRVISLTPSQRRTMRRLIQERRLGNGEAECLALARGRDALVLLDDKLGRTIAAHLNIRCVGTAGVLLESFLNGHVTFSELEAALRDLGEVLWLSSSVATEILRIARESTE